MVAIETNGLTKTFGDSVVAVESLDLSISGGEVYGFLGPNGAGKSTTINMLLNFIHPTSGSARVLGYDAREEPTAIRKRTGILPEGATLYDRLTGREHLELAMELKGVDDDPEAILDRVGLDLEDADRRTGGYSKGMGQRLGLGMALVGDPDLLILDEPSSGLDPNGIQEMRELIREEASDGTAVFFSSHILGEVEAVCDRIGILNDGKLVIEDTIEKLRASVDGATTLRISVPDVDERAVEATANVDGVTSVTAADGALEVEITEGTKFDVLNELNESDVAVRDFSVEESTLEDVFEQYTADEQVEA